MKKRISNTAWTTVFIFTIFILGCTEKPDHCLQCINKLRQIGLAISDYQDESDDIQIPWAGPDKKPWEHLQLLVDGGYVKNPELFICPASGMKPAKIDKSRNPPFKLGPDTCSYTTYIWPLSDSDECDRVIACDRKCSYHGNGRNVLMCDGTVQWREGTGLPDDVINVDGEKKK